MEPDGDHGGHLLSVLITKVCARSRESYKNDALSPEVEMSVGLIGVSSNDDGIKYLINRCSRRNIWGGSGSKWSMVPGCYHRPDAIAGLPHAESILGCDWQQRVSVHILARFVAVSQVC